MRSVPRRWTLSALCIGSMIGAAAAHPCASENTCTHHHQHDHEHTPLSADPVLHATMVEADDLVPSFIDPDVFKTFSPVHQRMLRAMNDAAAGNTPIDSLAMCLSDNATPELREAFELSMARLQPDLRYYLANRWGGSSNLGSPVTLTYSFVPDGTSIPSSSSGEPAAGSDLFAKFNILYGNSSTWQSHFHSVFARWSQLSGVTYVYEPNDDGAAFSSGSPGVNGVRGDIRIGGKFIDGSDTGSGTILAYNYYPTHGDMVLDTADSFFSANAGQNNDRFLRNTVAHEHGHGLGFEHVCPVNRTKLMEPFLTTLYDGPQHDDIRAVHRQYGDPYEPDNTAATATDLGTLPLGTTSLGAVPAPAVANGSILSIDADNEQDYFKFTIPSPRRVSVTLTPIGITYSDTDTSGSCPSTNTSTNSLAVADLMFQIVGSSGTNALTTINATAAGSPETISNFSLPNAGTYYIRVFENNAPSQTQLYTLSLGLISDLPMSINISSPPTNAQPGEPTPITVTIVPGDDTIVAGSPTLFYRTAPGAYSSLPLTLVSGTTYTATLPAFTCDDQPQYYVAAQGVETGVITSPVLGAAEPYDLVIGSGAVLADLNFETTTGWTVSGAPADGLAGRWEAGVPITCSATNNRGQPAADYDGSGTCFLTGNVQSAPQCNTDVDNGSTILTSPAYNAAGYSHLTLSYARWFSNTEGDNPFTNTFTVEASTNNGLTWTVIETVGPSTTSTNPEVDGGWFYKTYELTDFITPTAQVRVRFVANDTTGAVVEAAVDAFSLVARNCTDPTGEPCPADYNDDSVVDVADLFAYINAWLAKDSSADFNNDSAIDVADLFAYINAWLAKCV